MQPQVNDSTIVLKVSQQFNSDFPVHVSLIGQAVRKARQNDPILAALNEQLIFKKVYDSNKKMIQWKFIDLMQNVLRKIQPEIKHYPQHKSIKYLESIIYEHLDPEIFDKSVRISKIRDRLLGNSLDSSELSLVDKLLTELLTIMSQLLQIMNQHYGMPRDQKVSGILFQCIHMFVLENQNCFLVQQDSKIIKSSTKNGQTSGKNKDELISTLEKINEENKDKNKKPQSGLQLAEGLIGQLYSSIRQVNPFNHKKLTQKQIEQKKNLLKQMQHVHKRQILDESSIKIIENLDKLNLLQIIATMTKQQKAQFTSILFDALQETTQNKSKINKMEIIQQELVSLLESTINNEQMVEQHPFNSYRQIKWIVLLYKALQKQYHTDSLRRKWLMKFCENQHICNKVKNPFFVIKVLQSAKLQQNNVIKALRNLPLAEKLDKNKKNENITQKIIDAHLTIQHQMNRIHLYQLKKKYPKQPTVQIERLTSSKRRVVTFLFSGFLSEDTCKVQEWSGLLNNFYDSQVYSVRWQSKSVSNMMEFAYKSILDFGPTQSIAMLGGPYVKAVAIMHNLYQKFQDNPFNPAFQAAILTGQFFAEFLISNFKGYFINLVGFSLGTQLIRNIMSRLAQKNHLHILNKVYLLGGVADKNSVQKLIQSSPSPLTIINLHSNNDYILKYLLRLCKWGIQPVGLSPIKQIEGHVIKNEDCTYYVQGHLSYRPNLQFFGKWLKMADD